MSELKKLDMALTILMGCPHCRAALLIHIQRCEPCRLAFQQVVDKMLEDAPRELRTIVSNHLKQRMEEPEVVQAQAELLQAEATQQENPANRPN